jgi:hypothetical protein
MADGKQQCETVKNKAVNVEEEGIGSRAIKFLQFVSNYGKEDRYDPDFTWYGRISSHHSLINACPAPFIIHFSILLAVHDR